MRDLRPVLFACALGLAGGAEASAQHVRMPEFPAFERVPTVLPVTQPMEPGVAAPWRGWRFDVRHPERGAHPPGHEPIYRCMSLECEDRELPPQDDPANDDGVVRCMAIGCEEGGTRYGPGTIQTIDVCDAGTC
jgi:hypothetical protein